MNKFKCSCPWQSQAGCQWSKANGIPNSKVKKDMSDCMAPPKECSYQVH